MNEALHAELARQTAKHNPPRQAVYQPAPLDPGDLAFDCTMLSFIYCTALSRGDWLNVLFAYKFKHGEAAYGAVREWSMSDTARFDKKTKFDNDWRSAAGPGDAVSNPVQMGTVAEMAKAGGWTGKGIHIMPVGLTRISPNGQHHAESPHRADGERRPWGEVLAELQPGATPPPVPPVVCRDPFGLPLLHGEELTFLYGRAKSGKSFASLGLAKQVVEQGGRCLMVCWERTGKNRTRRHLATKGRHDEYSGWLVATHTTARDYLPELVDWLDEAPAGLVVFDSMSSAGVPTDGTPFSEFYWANMAPYAAPNRALLAIDHSVKRHERGTAPGPLGSTTKAAIADAFYLMKPGRDGFAITESAIELKGANDDHTPEKWVLRMKDSIPTVWNGNEQQIEQLFAMVAADEVKMSVRAAHKLATEQGLTNESHSTFHRRFERWRDGL